MTPVTPVSPVIPGRPSPALEGSARPNRALPARAGAPTASTRRLRRDDGMSLVEILVAISIMGLLASTLSVIVVTALRLSPAAEDRNDDANGLLTLTAFMPEDVNSTPAGGFEFDAALPSGCATTNPGVNLVRMTWDEETTTTTTWIAAYRYEDDGDGHRVVRYTCAAGQTPRIADMTDPLVPIDESTWTAGSAPVAIAPHADSSGVFNGLTFDVETTSGDVFTLEMRTNDLDETLPPVPPYNAALTPPSNQAPTTTSIAATIPHGASTPIGVVASDPDGDGLTLTITNLPANWTRHISGLTVELKPNPASAVGTTTNIDYQVMDPWGEVATGTMAITIAASATPNQPPTAAPATGVVTVGSDLVIDLPASDPDGDPLTVTTSTPHPSLAVAVNGTQLVVASDGSAPGPFSMTYAVDDGNGGTATSTLDLTVDLNPCTVTSLTPSATSVEVKNNGYLRNSVTYTITTTGYCDDLVLGYDNNLEDGGTDLVYLSFGSGSTVTVHGGHGGLKWSAGARPMTVYRGPAGTATLSTTLQVTT
ncbi:Ig-like domain-containing protein [Ilumatobacter sp.]|uniref:PulJ/GspJ family protein n=1 Tax=Ilumatobacter sp. TaxID=1967498 RepID=UPI003B52F188